MSDRSAPTYTHGDTGSKPSTSLNFQGGDNPKANRWDWFIYELFEAQKQWEAEFNELDADNDGIVDEADYANDSDASTYKGTDIDSNGDGRVDLADSSRSVNGADARYDYFDQQNYGTVPAGDFVPIGSVRLDAGETFYVTQATLTKDGLNTPAPSGMNLVLADENDDDTSGPSATLISGDGTTVYGDVEGTSTSAIASYNNGTTSAISVVVALNNGDLGQTGVGSDTESYGGFIGRIE